MNVCTLSIDYSEAPIYAYIDSSLWVTWVTQALMRIFGNHPIVLEIVWTCCPLDQFVSMTLKMGVQDIPESLVNFKLLDWLETLEKFIYSNSSWNCLKALHMQYIEKNLNKHTHNCSTSSTLLNPRLVCIELLQLHPHNLTFGNRGWSSGTFVGGPRLELIKVHRPQSLAGAAFISLPSPS